MAKDSALVTTEFQRQKESLLVESKGEAQGMKLAKQAQRMNNPTDLVELARVVQSGDSYTKAVVGGKLEIISEQIKMLQQQARQVLEDAQRDVELNHARCNFQRRPGTIYHLYRHLDEHGNVVETFWSMLSPEEWGAAPAGYHFVGSYRFEYDRSYTPVEDLAARAERRSFDPKMLGLSTKSGQMLALDSRAADDEGRTTIINMGGMP